MNCFGKKHCNEMSLRLIRTSVIHNDKTTLHTQKKTFHYTNEISGFKVRQTK